VLGPAALAVVLGLAVLAIAPVSELAIEQSDKMRGEFEFACMLSKTRSVAQPLARSFAATPEVASSNLHEQCQSQEDKSQRI
jgi:hypothetical protein